MAEASLLRTVHFSAGHRYWREEWSEEKNREVFGASTNPHGHNYELTVTVRGPIDEDTGFVVDLGALDRLLEDEVEALDQRDLNEAVEEVRTGAVIPTTECLARWFFQRLTHRIPEPARLVAVRLAESGTLAAEYRGEEG